MVADTTINTNPLYDFCNIKAWDTSAIKLIPFSNNLHNQFYDSVKFNKVEKQNIHTNFTIINEHFYSPKKADSILFTHSILQNHCLQTKYIHPHVHNVENTDWIFGVFLLCVLFFSWSKLFYKKRLSILFKAFFARRLMNQLVRDGNLVNERISIPLSFIYIASFSFLIYLSMKFSGYVFSGFEGFFTYLKIFIAIVSLSFAKFLIIRFIGNIFKNYDQSFEYRITELMFYLVYGIISIPFLLLINYSESIFFLYILLFISAIWFCYKLFRDFAIGLSNVKFPILYILLYICTVEIMPLFVIIKLAMTYS